MKKKKRWCLALAALAAASLLVFASCSSSDGEGDGGDQAYVVFAWNDLGMHCLNPTYDKAVLLPPYNTVWAQVVKRGNPPEVVTSGITVEYSVVGNTTSADKQHAQSVFGQFWTYCNALFGVSDLETDKGLNLDALHDPSIRNGMSGTMAVETDHFHANGIPVTPVDDAGAWNPYQVVEITVKDASGQTVATTRTTIPTSDEIHCDSCHGTPGNVGSAFDDILAKHNADVPSETLTPPVLCAWCHGSPALGAANEGSSGVYLSKAIHGYHAELASRIPPVTAPTCYQCHPGDVTRCSRSLRHTASDGACDTCHGDLGTVASTIFSPGGRVPWVNEPKCATCHDAAGAIAEVDTGSTLYRNAKGGSHGGGTLYCAACHSSPHAMVPSSRSSDNYQAMQYQDSAKSIGSCGACHPNSRGEPDFAEFGEAHAGTGYEAKNACHICHTAVSTVYAEWPHEFEWKAR